MTTRTPNVNLAKPEFNTVTWHDEMNDNFDKLDEALDLLGFPANDGIWANGVAYAVNDRLVDDATGTLWDCLVAHTSAATGLFSADRTAHPSYWVQVRSGLRWRGGWVTGTAYRVQDAVNYNGSAYICLVAHTAGVFNTDLTAVKWEVLAAQGSPGVGSGTVTGPVSSVVDRIATFTDTSGIVIKDSGILVTDLAPKASPAFSGTPTAPTAAGGTNSTQLATTAFVKAAIDVVLGGVSAAFDTLSEIATALAGKLTATANLSDVASPSAAYANIKQAASEAASGAMEIATVAETDTGTDDLRAITPLKLANYTKPLCVFFPFDGEPPSSNYATLGMRNGHPYLAFDTTTQWTTIFTGIMPRSYRGGSLIVTTHSMLASATSGTLGYDVAFERIDANATDLDADSFAATQTIATATVPGTSGAVLVQSVTFTSAQIDGLLAGEPFRLRIRRDVANDTAAGDAQLLAVEIRAA